MRETRRWPIKGMEAKGRWKEPTGLGSQVWLGDGENGREKGVKTNGGDRQRRRKRRR